MQTLNTIESQFKTESVKGETLDCTPTPDGYAAIGIRFAAQILDDVKTRRHDDDQIILVSLLEIAGYLAVNHREQFTRLLATVRP